MEVFPAAGLERLYDAGLKGKSFHEESRRPVRAKRSKAVKKQTPELIEPQRPVISRSAHVSTIRIKNFRAIHDVRLSIDDLDTDETAVSLRPEYGALDQRTIPNARRWWSLLGENGSGKSSILQAVGLALAGEKIDSILEDAELDWSKLLRRVPAGSSEKVRQGRVCLDFSDGTRVDLRFSAKKHWWVPDMRGVRGEQSGEAIPRSGLPVVEAYIRGYGATRLLEQGAISPNLDNVRVANLFDPRVAVINAKEWLLALDPDEFNVAAPTISNLLHHQGLAVDELDAATASSTKRKLLLTRNITRKEVDIAGVPIELASDGYRAVVAFVSDIMAGLGTGLSTMEHAPGIVLIDEIGAHLHPRWRMSITSKLRRALLQVQFIVSTHEPLCLRGLFEREVVRIEKHPQYGVLVSVIDRNPSHYRVDQLLTSEFFGLDTTIEPDLERRFQHYYRLLALETRSPEQEKVLADLFQYLQQHARPSLGHTRRDQMVYEEIDKYLSSEYQQPGRQLSREEFIEARKDRRRKALESVRDIWERRRVAKVSRNPE